MQGFPTDGAVDVEGWLAEHGEVFTVIRGHDSGCTSYGFAGDTGRWFVKPHQHPRSALNRLRSRSLADVLEVCDEVVAAHETVVARGFVAVDMYDGCLIYDFERSVVHLVDLDL